jgi:hypothetical protein
MNNYLEQMFHIIEGYLKLLIDKIKNSETIKVKQRKNICNNCRFKTSHGFCHICGCYIKAKIRVNYPEDENGNICYLEVEHKKPIDVLRSFFEEKPEISKRGLSILDSLFGDDEIEEDNLEENKEEPEEKPELQAKSNVETESKSYLEKQFEKINEDKINELKKRIEDAEIEIRKIRRDITINESKLQKQTKDLSILESRLDSFNVSDDPNGYVFHVSEEQKPEEIGLTQENRIIADKIADIIGIDKEKLFSVLTEGYYIISIAEKSNMNDEKVKITNDILQKIESLTNDSLESKITIIEPGKIKYSGSMNWHQITNKMIRKGFEQDQDFDNMFNKEENKEEIKNKKEMKIRKFNEMGEIKTNVLKTFTVPTDFVILGSMTDKSDFSITDDFETLHIYVNGKKTGSIETDGFVTILSMEEYKNFKNSLSEEVLGLYECIIVSNYKGDINVGAKVDGEYTNNFNFNDYIAFQFNPDYEDYEVFINFPTGTKFKCQSLSETSKEDIEKEHDELRNDLIYNNMSKNELSDLIDKSLDRGDFEEVKKLSKYI